MNHPTNPTMRRALILWVILLLGTANLMARTILSEETALTDTLCVISGTVTDNERHPMAHVNISVPGGHIAVVTNDDGQFTLKCPTKPSAIHVSHIGYHPRHVPIGSHLTGLTIRLKPATVVLQDVVIMADNAEEILRAAISKIPDNYNRRDELNTCFYRETVQKRQRFVQVAEAVAQLYKTPVWLDPQTDRVAIKKGRRLLSPKAADTLGVKILGGPNTPIWLDIVKNHEIVLNNDDLQYYQLSMEAPVSLNERPQYVIRLTPWRNAPYALYNGRFYIDRETLAFTRAELELDMRDRDKATRYMLVKKPAGVRFKPREMTILVNYLFDGQQTHISYVRTFFRFNCDWKKRFFATSFTAQSEIVVTDRQIGDVRPPRGRDTFYQRDAFFDKVGFFYDADFWRDYNIIKPTESLESAIGKLRKQVSSP